MALGRNARCAWAPGGDSARHATGQRTAMSISPAAPQTAPAEDGNVRLHEKAKLYTPGGLHTAIRIAEPPLCIRRSQGAYLWDENGERYIDYHATFDPINLRHCYPAVRERVVQALTRDDQYAAPPIKE